MELRRIDLDEKAAQLADSLSRLGGSLLQQRGQLGWSVVRGGRERVGDPGEVLHDPVVEISGDAPPLDLGRVDRALQQLHALALTAPHPTGRLPRERKLDEREQDERTEAHDRELPEDSRAARP